MVVVGRPAVSGLVGDARGGARRDLVSRIDSGIVGLLGQQRVWKDARGDRPGFLFLSEVVLALRPLDDLAGVLIEVKARAAPKERRRDRHCDHFDSPGACDRFHPGLRDSRFEAMFGIEAAMRQGVSETAASRTGLGFDGATPTSGRAAFDNPPRSWNMNLVRSLDLARG